MDLSTVVGCTHPDYRDRSWGELKPIRGTLESASSDDRFRNQGLKRAKGLVYDLNDNPTYYVSLEKKKEWYFYRKNGRYYIGGDVHRTVAARYFYWLNNLPPIVHGVTVYQLGQKTVSPCDQIDILPEKTLFQKVGEFLFW